MDETLLARLSLKWNLPLDCLASDLPHIHELVESRDWAAGDSNHDTRDGQPADDAREIFFFQFPLGDDRIEMVDSVEVFKVACASLKVLAVLHIW